MSAYCDWASSRLPHTEHGDCPGFLPRLAVGLRNLMTAGPAREGVDFPPLPPIPVPEFTPAGPDAGDLLDHELSEDCICGPTAVPIKREDGSVGWVYEHHSLDGREARE